MLLRMVLALTALCCGQVVHGAQYYYLFLSTATDGNFGGAAGAKTLCENSASTAGLHLDNTNIYALVSGSDILTSWEDTRVVVSLLNSSFQIATAANFKAGVLDRALYEVGLCSALNGKLWIGLNNNFAVDDTCDAWTSTSNVGTAIRCDKKTIIYTGSQNCPQPFPILCVYVGNTRAPSTSPSKSPSKSPTTSRPSRNPTTSRPSLNPTTSRPSTSPTTSVPTQSPARSSKAPTTSAPVVSEGSGTDLSVIGIPIGVGVGGGALFLLVLAAIFVTRSRKKARGVKKDSVTASMGNSGK